MDNKPTKGYIAPLLLVIIAILVIGGGIYIYTQNKKIEVNKDVSVPIATNVVAGCGTSCMYLFALDKNTGKVYRVGSKESFSDYSIVENQIRAKDQNGQTFIYIFNPTKNSFEEFPV